MPTKSHRAVPGAAVEQDSARSRESPLDPRSLLTLGFALYGGARLPDVSMVHAEPEGSVRVWLMDEDGSGAIADLGDPVWQYGPRDLWAEVEAAHQEYVDLGRPEADAFGLSVTDEYQRVWLHGPDAVIQPAV